MKQVGIENKSFFVRIGNEEKEREFSQEVLITAIIDLKDHQKGSFTDNIVDVYDYSKIVQIIKTMCQPEKEYHLLEFFAMQIKNSIIKELNIQSHDAISVKVFKKSYQSFCVV